jgi:hypothetical protein
MIITESGRPSWQAPVWFAGNPAATAAVAAILPDNRQTSLNDMIPPLEIPVT